MPKWCLLYLSWFDEVAEHTVSVVVVPVLQTTDHVRATMHHGPTR
jgi:hypothetical protein